MHWTWEIPGRKREQIEAFAAAAGPGKQPVLDWCGGKGHLGRLLALAWQQPVHTLDIDAGLCEAGNSLARRANARQEFVVSDALTVADWPQAGQHAVALHACGELHRRLVREGVGKGVGAFDVAPCCYYRGLGDNYRPLSDNLTLQLTRDDTRLAVTETVTSSARETRQRDRGISNSHRQMSLGRTGTRSRGLPMPSTGVASEFEMQGWQRRDEVMRFSIVRHAFRRAIEVWLVLDLACYLEERGYAVALGSFCERHLTPRNLLISARLA